MSNYDIGYRGGLILGFTMAEVMILLIFSLVLILSYIINEKDKQLQDTIKELVFLEEKKHILIERLEDENKFDELFQELEVIKNALPKDKKDSLTDSLQILIEKSNTFDQIKSTLAQNGIDITKIEELKVITSTLKALQNNDININDANAIENFINKKLQLEQELNRLKEQTQNWKKKLNAIGKGTEAPACWTNANTGKIEYIFDVRITSNGLIIQDNELVHRIQEQSELPLIEVEYNTELNTSSFKSALLPLYEWSKAKQCRFFVRTYDQTSPLEKNSYKKYMRTIGSIFYYYEVLDN